MNLKEIDKTIYRKHLNIIIVGFISSLLILALAYGQGLIALFAEPVNNSAEQKNNFQYNFLGVVFALLSCVFALHRLRSSDFFCEVYYVWQVKQQQNAIYRKLKKIKAAAQKIESEKAGQSAQNTNAMIILTFYYASLKQIYQLDDNTLTMSKLNKDMSELDTLIENQQLKISIEQYQPSMLADF